eukprot:6197217-Pleurochrysis_carterae.AAC.2
MEQDLFAQSLAAEGAALCECLGDLPRHAEVSQLDLPARRVEDIRSLTESRIRTERKARWRVGQKASGVGPSCVRARAV